MAVTAWRQWPLLQTQHPRDVCLPPRGSHNFDISHSRWQLGRRVKEREEWRANREIVRKRRHWSLVPAPAAILQGMVSAPIPGIWESELLNHIIGKTFHLPPSVMPASSLSKKAVPGMCPGVCVFDGHDRPYSSLDDTMAGCAQALMTSQQAILGH